jgi:NAD(P)-dependent dehydrogenase (short-subunit alcohol dehydrogenase family)
MNLKGKRVWVLGTTGTIGSAVAEKFKKEGAEIYTSSRKELFDWYSFSKLANKIKPDVLINCTGTLSPESPLQETKPLEWIVTVNINLTTSALLTQSVLSGMIERGGGKIIHLSGGGAAYGIANRSAYAASKAGLVRFVECVAEETKDLNIQINAIAPGPVKSKMNPESDGTPDKAVELALFLASEKSGALTGRLISAVHDNWEALRIMNVRVNLPKEAGKLRRIPLNQ